MDILLIGGGMACCGAGYEIMRWIDAAKKGGTDISVKLVDKAVMDRSGAVAQGLSAINTYLGTDLDPADYARMVSNDLMGITRDDLSYDLGRHVDESVHLFEEWGLPIWKMDENGERHDGSKGLTPLKDGGKPVRSGKWQIMINGESYSWVRVFQITYPVVGTGVIAQTTVKGLFTAGDGVGASGHKFSSGSHAEGRLAAKAMVKYVIDNKDYKPELDTDVDQLGADIYQPVKTYYNTNEKMLAVAEEKLGMLKEDVLKMRAKDLHELLRAWENYHRILTAEAHMKHIQFRQESRYPGFYYRTDKNFVDEENWKCFVNSVYDKKTSTWTCFKRSHTDLVDKSKLFK